MSLVAQEAVVGPVTVLLDIRDSKGWLLGEQAREVQESRQQEHREDDLLTHHHQEEDRGYYYQGFISPQCFQREEALRGCHCELHTGTRVCLRRSEAHTVVKQGNCPPQVLLVDSQRKQRGDAPRSICQGFMRCSR